MSVVPLTLAISLSLVFAFIVFFLREHARGQLSSAERDSLLPLLDEMPRPVPVTAGSSLHRDGCRCVDSSQPRCPGCRR